MAVDFKRKEYTLNLPRWNIVDDCWHGMETLGARQRHILYFGSAKKTTEELARYATYVNRAIFTNYINRTIAGLTGLTISSELEYESSPVMEYAKLDIDGMGTTLEQSVKRTTARTIAHGRYGLMVDFPAAEGSTTNAQVASGERRATLTSYDSRNIINWDYTRVGSDQKLSMVVLLEPVQERGADGFEITETVQYRVLRLVGGVFTVTVYDSGLEIKELERTVYGGDGNALTEILFKFVGISDNNANIDKSVIYDIAVLNVGHFQNSADYENSLWLCGQPQPWIAGLTQNWVDKNFKDGVRLGSGAALMLPENAEFAIAQTEPNTQAFEAMGHKEKQMVAIGAKVITSGESFDTATEAVINNQGDNSVLQTVQDNVESAYSQVLTWMGAFVGDTSIVFSNPTDLSVYITDPQLVQQMRETWMAGLIGKTDVQDFLRRIGTVERTNEEINEEIDTTPAGVNLDE